MFWLSRKTLSGSQRRLSSTSLSQFGQYEAWTRPLRPASGSSAFTYAEIEDVSARLDAGFEVAETLPHRKKYLLLNHRLSERILAALSEWVDEVEAELGS